MLNIDDKDQDDDQDREDDDDSYPHRVTELQKRADRADQSVLIFPGRC